MAIQYKIWWTKTLNPIWRVCFFCPRRVFQLHVLKCLFSTQLLNIRKKAFFNVWWRTQPHSISEWIRWDPLIYPSSPPPPPSFLCTWLRVLDDLKIFQASSICRFFSKWVMDKAKSTLDLQGCEATRDWRDHICDFANHIATGESVKFFWRKKNSNNLPVSPIFFFKLGFFQFSWQQHFYHVFFFLARLSPNVPCTYHSSQNTTAQRCRLHT